MSGVRLALGVDVGGTKIAGGVVDDAGRVVDAVQRATPGDDPDATQAAIVDVIDTLRSRHDVLAVGVGAAAWIDSRSGALVFAPHIVWRGVHLQEVLATHVEVPVVVENDANAAAWAEYRFGAGRGYRVLACVTLGTGIGGGLVIDGRLIRGGHGMAGEFGHVTVVPDGRLCACGGRGCWEMYASGRALGRDARELAAQSPATAAHLIALAGGVEGIDGPLVAQAALDGDPAAVALCTTVGRWLGRGLAGLAAVLDPDIFVVGGGAAQAGDLLLGPAREEFELSLSGRGFRPVAPVHPATLGPQAGLVGAADLARLAAGAPHPPAG